MFLCPSMATANNHLVNISSVVMLFFPDFVVIGSDSGRIVILEYVPSKNAFEKVKASRYITQHFPTAEFQEIFCIS